MRLGAILKKWRLMSDLTVREAAAQIGVAPSTLVHIESGRMPPHSATLITLWNWVTAQEPEAVNESQTGAVPDAGDAGADVSVSAQE